VDLSADILDVWAEQGELCFRAKAQPSGATVSPYLVFAGLLGGEPEALRSRPICKDGYTLEGAAVP
jgi:hypothetical protein